MVSNNLHWNSSIYLSDAFNNLWFPFLQIRSLNIFIKCPFGLIQGEILIYLEPMDMDFDRKLFNLVDKDPLVSLFLSFTNFKMTYCFVLFPK